MDGYIRPRAYGQAGSLAQANTEKLVFLRKVYALFTGSLVAACAGAMIALYAGADLSRVTVPMGHGMPAVTIPPLIAFFGNHVFIGAGLFFAAFFGASYVRERPGINLFGLFGAAFISGLVFAPAIFFAHLMAVQGETLSTSPVRDAFLLTLVGFTGLTSYAMLSRRDFSFLRGFLSMGLWVVIGASLLSIFVGGTTFSLAIASVGVLLFGGFILYDTSVLVRDPSNRDPVGAAIGLYLNFLNLFMFLLRILASSSRRDG